jgi:hypothetical protein
MIFPRALVLTVAVFASCPVLAAAPAAKTGLTFWKEVLPVLQSKCQECHRKGEIGPMPLTSYKEARPWASAISESVKLRKMPPWFADPHFGKFSNDRSLSETEIATLTGWASQGAPEGNPKDAPQPRLFNAGWNIPTPDLVLQSPTPMQVPASGQVDYQYIVLPTGFTEDHWVRMAETRPSDRAVVHHLVVFIRDAKSPWLRDAKPGVPFVPATRGDLRDISGGGSEILTIYTPGMTPEIWKPTQGKLIKAGSDLVLQVHYTTNGKATSDQTKVGLVFSKETPTERILNVSVANTRFVIPPGDPAFEVTGRVRFPNPGQLINLFPHMHLRGKDFEYRAVFPDGTTQVLLKVPAYNFNWQLAYHPAEPWNFPAGTRIEATAHFDNSANNPANPDPKAEVHFGEQSWEEMMLGFMDVAVPANMDLRAFMTPPKPQAAP